MIKSVLGKTQAEVKEKMAGIAALQAGGFRGSYADPVVTASLVCGVP